MTSDFQIPTGRQTLRLAIVIAAVAVLSLLLVACGKVTDGGEKPGPITSLEVLPTNTAAPVIAGTEESSVVFIEEPTVPEPYLVFNQRWLEGLRSTGLDVTDVDEVFSFIFSKLPDEVVVYPTENYYYYKLYVDGKQLWGNIRLAAGRRERGVLSFAYFEFRESPYVTEPRLVRNKFFTDADGVRIEELDKFTFKVRYEGRDVVFHLNQISQVPPALFKLGENEEYIEKTYDESGYNFILLFNTSRNYFNWVLNEEVPVPDQLMPIGEDLLIGRRSGFAFWVDRAHDNRKILVAIRGQSATRNNYYDGPFDQLADNYVDETNLASYVVRASPSLEGRIDKWGYFTDSERPSRVSISPYYVYFTDEALKLFVDQMKRYPDPYYFVSRKGVIPTPVPVTAAPSNQRGG